MITFSILMIVLLVIATILAAFGAGFLAVFGDILVCGLIIYGLVKLFRRKK